MNKINSVALPIKQTLIFPLMLKYILRVEKFLLENVLEFKLNAISIHELFLIVLELKHCTIH